MDPRSQPEEDTHRRRRAEKRQKELLETTTSAISILPGLGERLLPYLVAAMETCWVDAVLITLVSLNLFQRHALLLPLWSPFVLIASACGLMIFLERREIAMEQAVKSDHKRVTGSSWFVLLMTLLVLIVVWADVYATPFLFFDPRWLLIFLNDLFQLDGNFYYVLLVAALAIYFCWRGVRLAHRTIEPGSIFWNLRLGMGIIIVAIIMHIGSVTGSFNEFILFGIVPLFLFFALVAHALAKALFLRRSAPGGLQGSVAAQERAILTMMGIIGLIILLLAFSIGSFASPAFLQDVQHGLEPLGRFYDWLVSIIAYGITFLLYPLFWLLSLIHITMRPSQISPTRTPVANRVPQAQGGDPIITIIVPVLKIVLPLLFIVLMIRLIMLLLNRRRIRLVRTEQQDISESLWSWNLFLMQLKELLLAIWYRFFPRRANKPEAIEEASTEEETARSIRAIYRALLRWATNRGYRRRREETPYEFKERLQQKILQSEPELSDLTEAYTGLRYGGNVPNEEEVIQAQKDWVELQRKTLLS